MVLDIDFWGLIDQARGGGDSCTERARALERLLGNLPPTEIEEFAQKQAELMRASYRLDLWGAAFVIKGGCSDDAFDYFRGWLLLRGREVWDAALRDPESLADVAVDGDAECEDVLYVASEAYERVTGRGLPSDGGSQPREPAGTPWKEADLETLYPRLWKRSVTESGGGERQAGGVGDVWDQMMGLGFSMLTRGSFEPAAKAFSAVRQHTRRQLTRTIATNNLAWTDLMIDTPVAVIDALLLAREAQRMMEEEPQKDRFMGPVRGTLVFALIKNDQVKDGLALIEDVLATDQFAPQLLALQLCVKAIGLARSGDVVGARALISRARKADPKCQLLSQAGAAAGGMPPPAAPEHLSQWLARFGIADDLEREQVIRRGATEELIALVKAVDKEALQQINRYLEETDDAENAVPYGDLAQAAMEANLELRRRGVPEV